MVWRKSTSELNDAFLAALPKSPRIERRRMFGYPAAFVNGNLFAGVHQDDILVRLPEGERQMLLSQGGRRWEPTPGRVMKDYLLLPVDAEPTTLARWLKRSLAYAASLPERRQKTQRSPRK